MADRVRIGTRGSRLALRQAELVAEALRRAWPGLGIELVTVRTTADRLPDANLAIVGGKGLFVKEIEEALLAEEVDLAVHSLKDLPADLQAGLALVAYPPREDPRDALIGGAGDGLRGLRPGARVGTSSPRRKVQLLGHRPDLAVEPIRGNVDTRLRKLEQGSYDAVVLAAAGLWRLGLRPPGTTLLEIEEMLPAVGQGVLAVEVREDDRGARRLVTALDHAETRLVVEAERAFLAAIGGSCTTPLAAHARRVDGALRLDALVAAPDGERVIRDVAHAEAVHGDTAVAAELGRGLAARMLRAGADEILAVGRPG